MLGSFRYILCSLHVDQPWVKANHQNITLLSGLPSYGPGHEVKGPEALREYVHYKGRFIIYGRGAGDFYFRGRQK